MGADVATFVAGALADGDAKVELLAAVKQVERERGSRGRLRGGEALDLDRCARIGSGHARPPPPVPTHSPAHALLSLCVTPLNSQTGWRRPRPRRQKRGRRRRAPAPTADTMP